MCRFLKGSNAELKGWVQNGTLHVSGLTTGESWTIYNLYGQRIYNGISDGGEAKIPLQERGVYIIQSGGTVIKSRMVGYYRQQLCVTEVERHA